MAAIFCQLPLRIAPSLREWLEREAQCRGGISINATVVQCLEEARLRRDEDPCAQSCASTIAQPPDAVEYAVAASRG